MSVEIYLAGLVVILIGACLQVVVGVALAGLHVVGAMTIVAALLEMWLIVTAAIWNPIFCARFQTETAVVTQILNKNMMFMKNQPSLNLRSGVYSSNVFISCFAPRWN